jgi:hypothetical protein
MGSSLQTSKKEAPRDPTKCTRCKASVGKDSDYDVCGECHSFIMKFREESADEIASRYSEEKIWGCLNCGCTFDYEPVEDVNYFFVGAVMQCEMCAVIRSSGDSVGEYVLLGET